MSQHLTQDEADELLQIVEGFCLQSNMPPYVFGTLIGQPNIVRKLRTFQKVRRGTRKKILRACEILNPVTLRPLFVKEREDPNE